MSEVVFGMRLSLYLFRGAYNFLSHRIYSWFMVIAGLSFSFHFLYVPAMFGNWSPVQDSFSCSFFSLSGLEDRIELVFLKGIMIIRLSSLSFSFPFYFSAGQGNRGKEIIFGFINPPAG